MGTLALAFACQDKGDPMCSDCGTAGGSGGSSSGGGSSGGKTSAEGGAGGDVSSGGKVDGQGGSVGQAGAGAAVGEGGSSPIEGGADGQGGEGGVGDAGHSATGGSGTTSSGGVSATTGGATSSGTGGATTVVSNDTCTALVETVPNNDAATATAYTLGTAYSACLQSSTDVDVYAFQVPNDSRGGYVTVSVTGVGPSGDIAIKGITAADDGEFVASSNDTDGGSTYMYFAAKPGAKFYIPVTHYVNQTGDQSVHVQGRLHAGSRLVRAQRRARQCGHDHRRHARQRLHLRWAQLSSAIPAADWADWYKVDLTAKAVGILVEPAAADIDTNVVLYNSVGTEVATKGTNTELSSVDLQYTVATAGTYYIKVSPYLPPTSCAGTTVTVPQYFTLPYKLTVSQ
ncbi:MAG: hypothetical protein QM756_41380 [Polyangiaceae bacterium]